MTKPIALALVLSVAGCTGTGVAPGPSEVCRADGQTVVLAARYGIQANFLVNVRVTPTCTGPSCIVDADADAGLLLIADVTQTGRSAILTARPCALAVPPVVLKGGNKPVQLAAPLPLLESVKPVLVTGMMDSTQTCANFGAMAITLAIGASLTNPGSDPLPLASSRCGGMATTRCLSATTPSPGEFGCVCDQEGDGNLGATLDAMNAPVFEDIDKVYVDLRAQVILTGQVFPPAPGQANPGPRIKGKAGGLKLDQNLLGCHRSAAAGGVPRDCDDVETKAVNAFTPAITQSLTRESTFIAVPLAANATCNSLIAQEKLLFQ